MIRPCQFIDPAGANRDLPDVEFLPQYRVKNVFTAFIRLLNNWQAFFIIKISNHFPNAKLYFMSGLLYLIAVILIIGWILGVFVYSVGGLIHVLIVLAIISLVLGIIRRA